MAVATARPWVVAETVAAGTVRVGMERGVGVVKAQGPMETVAVAVRVGEAAMAGGKVPVAQAAKAVAA